MGSVTALVLWPANRALAMAFNALAATVPYNGSGRGHAVACEAWMRWRGGGAESRPINGTCSKQANR